MLTVYIQTVLTMLTVYNRKMASERPASASERPVSRAYNMKHELQASSASSSLHAYLLTISLTLLTHKLTGAYCTLTCSQAHSPYLLSSSQVLTVCLLHAYMLTSSLTLLTHKLTGAHCMLTACLLAHKLTHLTYSQAHRCSLHAYCTLTCSQAHSPYSQAH